MFKKVYFWIIAVLVMIAVVYAQQVVTQLTIVPAANGAYVFVIKEAGHGKDIFRVDTSNDLVAIQDDLTVSNDATISGDLAVTGTVTLSGDLTATTLSLTTNSITAGTGFWDDAPSQASNDLSQAFFYTEDFVGVVLDTIDGIGQGDAITGVDATISGWKFVGNTGAAMAQAAGTLGGIVTFRAVTGSNNEAYWQIGQLNTETYVEFTGSSGKEVWVEFEVSSDDITASAAGFFIGLADEAANAADFMNDNGADFGDDDIVGFYQAEANEDTIEFIYQTTGSAFVRDTLQAIAAATYYTLGIHFDGVTTITYYIDGTSAGTVATTATGFPDTEELSPMIAIKNGAQDRILSVDWIKLVSER